MRILRLHPIKFMFDYGGAGGHTETIVFVDLSEDDELSPLIGRTDVGSYQITESDHVSYLAREWADDIDATGRCSWEALDPDSGEGYEALREESEEIRERLEDLTATLTQLDRDVASIEDPAVLQAAAFIRYLRDYDGGRGRIRALADRMRDEDISRRRSGARLVDDEDRVIVHKMAVASTLNGYTVWDQEGRSRKIDLGDNCSTSEWSPCDLGQPGRLLGSFHGVDELIRAIVEHASHWRTIVEGGIVLLVIGEEA